jgi:hypothetical protein
MATAFIVLAYIGTVPVWLAILVISRDLFILVGSSLYLILIDASDIRPTALSKLNTAVQILTVVYFLALAAFPRRCGPARRNESAVSAAASGCARDHRVSERSTCTWASGSSPMAREGERSSPFAGRPRRRGGHRWGPDPFGVREAGRDLLDLLPDVREPVHPPLRDRSGEERRRRAGALGGRMGTPGADPAAAPKPVHLQLSTHSRGLAPPFNVMDEDVRLSFLHGQYVTFFRPSEEETRKSCGTGSLRCTFRSTRPRRTFGRRMLAKPERATSWT